MRLLRKTKTLMELTMFCMQLPQKLLGTIRPLLWEKSSVRKKRHSGRSKRSVIGSRLPNSARSVVMLFVRLMAWRNLLTLFLTLLSTTVKRLSTPPHLLSMMSENITLQEKTAAVLSVVLSVSYWLFSPLYTTTCSQILQLLSSASLLRLSRNSLLTGWKKVISLKVLVKSSLKTL